MGQVGFLEIDFKAVAGLPSHVGPIRKGYWEVINDSIDNIDQRGNGCRRRLYPCIATKQVTQFDRFSEIS